MSAAREEFGSWHTASDGTAHYVLGGKCLCGAKAKNTDPPPGALAEVALARHSVMRQVPGLECGAMARQARREDGRTPQAPAHFLVAATAANAKVIVRHHGCN